MQLNPNAMDALGGFGHWIAGRCVGHDGDVRSLDMLSIFGLYMFRLYAELCSLDFWSSGGRAVLEFWTSRFGDFRFLDFWILGFLDFWISGF